MPEVLVPDQFRSAISGPDRYDPDINATLPELAKHYGTTIIPARPRKPRDQAKVETAVLIVQRWILAQLRHRRFFSLEELNVAIAELVVELNARPFRKLDGSRKSAFEALDRPALSLLPSGDSSRFNGRRPACTPITTSHSRIVSTACRTRSSASAWSCVRRRSRSRFFMAVSA